MASRPSLGGPAKAWATSSQLFANNIVSFLRHLAPSGELVIDRDDEITAATLVSIDGELVHPEVAARLDQQNGERNQTGASR